MFDFFVGVPYFSEFGIQLQQDPPKMETCTPGLQTLMRETCLIPDLQS